MVSENHFILHASTQILARASSMFVIKSNFIRILYRSTENWPTFKIELVSKVYGQFVLFYALIFDAITQLYCKQKLWNEKKGISWIYKNNKLIFSKIFRQQSSDSFNVGQ